MADARPSSRDRGLHSRTRAEIDTLEQRLILSLVYLGTAAADNIVIRVGASNTLIVEVNGLAVQPNDEPGDDLVISSLAGDDTISLESLPSTSFNPKYKVLGGDGNDTFRLTSHNLSVLHFVADPFLFDGGNGADTLIADNTADAHSADIAIYATPFRDGIVRNDNEVTTGSNVLEFDETERVQYLDSDFGNHIQFDGLRASGTDLDVTVSGAGGNDDILNGNQDLYNDVPAGDLLIDAGAGTEHIVLDDSAAAFFDTYTFDSNTMMVAHAHFGGTVRYIGVEALDLVGTNLSDLVRLNSKTTVPLLLSMGDGVDNVTVGNGDLDSNGLLSGVTIFGGAGDDVISFDDQLDNDDDGTSSTYTMNNFALSKGAGSITYSAFESQTLRTENVVVSGEFNVIPVVNLNAVSSFFNSTTIIGGTSRGCTANVGNGNLTNVGGSLTVQGCTTVNINDQGSTANNSYQVTATQISRNNFTFASYSGVRKMTLNAGSGNDGISVLGTPLGTTVTVNADAGNDNTLLGNGNIDANLLGPVTVNGSTGTDSLTIDNHLDGTSETQTLGAFDFVDSGISYGYSGIEGAMAVNLGPGGNNLTVTGLLTAATVTGGSGTDTFTVGGGFIEANFPRSPSTGPVFDGAGGTDSIILNDFNAPAAGSYEFERPTGIDRLTRGNGNIYYINWKNIESATLEASNAPTTGNGLVGEFVDDLQTPLRINGNGGSDAVFAFDPAFPVTVNTGSGTMDELYVNFDAGAGDAPATVIVDQNDEIDLLDVRAGGTLRVTSGATLAKSHLNGTSSLFSMVGTIDLAGGALLSRSGGPTSSQFQTWLTRGYNGDGWNGTNASGAINSSLAASSSLPDAVGYGLGSDIAISSIGGFNIAPGDMLVRYTWYGDADLNGRVNFDDYVRTDNGFNNHRTGWVNGDFDYNSQIDFDDYVLIDLAFNTQSGTLRR
jgi:hypothetical protein